MSTPLGPKDPLSFVSLILSPRGIGLMLVAALTVVLWGLFGNTEDTATLGNSAFRWWWTMTAFGRDADHGRLIPLICAYFGWARRKELGAALVLPDWRGVPVAALALLLYWVGVQGQQVQVALYAFWVMVWAAILAFWGKEVTRILKFPLAYLALALPLGFLYPLTFPLRMVSTGMAAGLLNGIGIAVVRNGTALHDVAGTFHLEVADPCSGLRSVFALVAVTALYAYVSLKGYKRWVLVLAAGPLAVCGNAVRITAVGIVAKTWGQEAATGFYHDFSGYVFFISATLLMLGLAWLLGKVPVSAQARPPGVPVDRKAIDSVPQQPQQQDAPVVSHISVRGALIPGLGVATLMVLAATWVVLRPPLQVSDCLPIAAELPVALGEYSGERNYYCQNENCLRSFSESAGAATNRCPICGGSLDVVALAERRGLPADTMVNKRVYRNAVGSIFSVNTVIAGGDRRSIHRPEHCLPAQGLSIENIRRATLSLPQTHQLEVTLMEARREESGTRVGFAYWFVGPQRETTSHLARHFWMAHDRLLRNTASRWAYVSVYSPESFDSPDAMETLRQFLSLLHPALQPTNLP